MTLAQLVERADAMAAQIVALKSALGSQTVEEPSDDVGIRGSIGDERAAVVAYNADDWDAYLVALRADAQRAGYQNLASLFDARMAALGDLAQEAGYASLTAFLAGENAGAGAVTIGTYNTGLMAPAFGRGVYALTEGRNLEARNIYSSAIASMATKVVGGAFTHVADVNSALYAGAARAQIAVATITGTGTAIVTGTARAIDGTLKTGRSFSAAITGGSDTLLVPENAGDLLVSVTSISLSSGITAGTATVKCAIPSSRTSYTL